MIPVALSGGVELGARTGGGAGGQAVVVWLGKHGLRADGPFAIVAKVDPSVPQDIRRKRSDGREDKYIVVSHDAETEGIVIMGPSEHN
jgi:hypothetical protein